MKSDWPGCLSPPWFFKTRKEFQNPGAPPSVEKSWYKCDNKWRQPENFEGWLFCLYIMELMKLCFDFAFYPLRKMPVTTGIYMFKFKTPEVPPIPSFCSRVYNPTCRGPITPCITHVRAHPWTYCSRYSEALYLDHPLPTVEEFNSREYYPYDFFLQRAPIWRKASSSSPGFIMGFRAGARGVFRGL